VLLVGVFGILVTSPLVPFPFHHVVGLLGVVCTVQVVISVFNVEEIR